MELRWLEDFCVLAETSSFSRAAEHRHITQSAFSRRIKQLESWLGSELINRATLPAELTTAGQQFLPAAQEVIRTLYGAREMLQQATDSNMIRIAALHTLTITFFPAWVGAIRSRLSGLRSSIIPDRGGIEANLLTLMDAEADFFLTYAHPDVPLHLDARHFEFINIGKDRLLPVVAPHITVAGRSLSGIDLLDNAVKHQLPLPYLGYGLSSFFGVALQRLFARQPTFTRRIQHENTISAGLKRLALTGSGICWLPESLIGSELSSERLVLASAQQGWYLDLDIRLYRATENTTLATQNFWQAAQPPHLIAPDAGHINPLN